MDYISSFSILLLSVWLINCSITAPVMNNKIKSDENQLIKIENTMENIGQCQRSITYDEVRHILDHSPCASDLYHKKLFSNHESKIFTKRNDDNNATSSNHAYALQTTINDHRRMIYYLMNNTINITQLNQYYIEQHSKIAPIWNSWRDVSSIISIIICVSVIINLLVTRIHPIDALTSIILRHYQEKQQQNEIINKNIKMRHSIKDKQASMASEPAAATPPIATIQREYLRYICPSNSPSNL